MVGCAAGIDETQNLFPGQYDISSDDGTVSYHSPDQGDASSQIIVPISGSKWNHPQYGWWDWDFGVSITSPSSYTR